MEPHSLVRGTGEGGSVRLGPGLRPLRPMPHGPPTSSGGREKWFVDGRKAWKIERLLSAFSQRVPTHIPSPPSRWAGRYQRDKERAAGRVSHKKYSLPPHNPTREGSPEGRTSSLWGSFPHFFPRNGAPAGQATVPRRSNGAGEKPQRPHPPHAKTPSLWPKNSHSAHGSYQVSYSLTAQTDKNLSFPIKLLSSACQ